MDTLLNSFRMLSPLRRTCRLVFHSHFHSLFSSLALQLSTLFSLTQGEGQGGHFPSPTTWRNKMMDLKCLPPYMFVRHRQTYDVHFVTSSRCRSGASVPLTIPLVHLCLTYTYWRVDKILANGYLLFHKVSLQYALLFNEIVKELITGSIFRKS